VALPRRKATGFRAFPPGGLPTLAAQTPLLGFVMNMGRRKYSGDFLFLWPPKPVIPCANNGISKFFDFFLPAHSGR
jgi:hypothetical protein